MNDAGPPATQLKLYSGASPTHLDELIALPATMSVANRRRILRQTAWPQLRIVEHGNTVGALVRSAPLRMKAGSPPVFLNAGLLTGAPSALIHRGLREQSILDRIAVGRRLASLGAIFEQHNVVYADWSPAKVLWSPEDQSVFLTDVDTCAMGRPDDGYRLSLLIGQCLTGRRELPELMTALLRPESEEHAPAYDAIRINLLAKRADQRLSLSELWQTLQAVEDGRSYPPVVPCLPTYVVVDTSGSMEEYEQVLNETLEDLIETVASRPDLAEYAPICVIGFNTEAHVIVELTDVQQLRHLPEIECAGLTSYGNAFRRLRERIDVDLAELRRQGRPVLRPAVFLLTDGIPSDEDWETAYRELADPQWARRPHLVPFGFGEAPAEIIGRIATERAFLAKDAKAGNTAITEFLGQLLGTVLRSRAAGRMVPPVKVDGYETLC